MDNYNFLEIIGITAIGTIIFMTGFFICSLVREYYSERKDKSKDKQ